MDGIRYRVRVVYDSLKRSFSLQEGDAAGYMLSFRHERDLAGTSYSYQLGVEPDPAYPQDYDAFWEAVSAPVDSHQITMPYGQTTMTFQAEVSSGHDGWHGKLGGKNRWHGLVVNYKPIKPQRMKG